MADEGFKRKLTAILSTDAVDYSRLMGEDEAATVRTLKSYREVLRTLIRQHSGLVLDSPGDNLLAEFASVVDAVQCAVAIQKEIKARNDELPENRRMKFRIGINLGDVIEEKGQIYGDGVNVAARIEGLADSEGICISRTVYDQVKNKLELGYEYLGEHTVKNIADPIRVYRVLLDPGAVGKVIGEKKAAGKKWRRVAFAAVALLLLVATGFTVWTVYLQKTKRVEAASPDKMAYPLPNKPSIAVLPFVNLSGDAQQEYLADGITESLISNLSMLPKLFVIASYSTSTYKGKAVKIKQVSEELGVRYVVEGSIQQSGNNIRITARIIDAIKGYHLWGDRYERKIKDIFVLQDDITLNILKAIQLEMPDTFVQAGRDTNNIGAYQKYLQALYYHLRAIAEQSKKNHDLSKKLYRESISLDPNYAGAYLGLGYVHLDAVTFGRSSSPGESLKNAEEMAAKVMSLNPSYPGGHSLLAYIYLLVGQHRKAVSESKRALEINPDSEIDLIVSGQVFLFSGELEEAISCFEKYIRLNPYPPEYTYDCICNAYFLSGQFEKPVPFLKKAANRLPNSLFVIGNLVVAYSLLGRNEEAREQFEKYKKIPLALITREDLERYINLLPFKNQSDADRLKELCLKAGLGGDITQTKSN
jgi:adenylate cyclase